MSFRKYIIMLGILISMICSAESQAATRRVRGVVTDSISGEPVSLANIHLVKADYSLAADIEGRFIFTADDRDSIRISSYGYNPVTIAISRLPLEGGEIKMTTSVTDLAEFIVKPGKIKYTKRNNPAVMLMNKVRDCRKITDPRREDFYSYNSYERITLGLNNFDATSYTSGHKLEFLSEYADTARNTGLPVLLVSVREKSTTSLYASRPNRIKMIVTGEKSEGIDKAFDQENISKILRDVLREPDIYSNDITIIQNRFVSPLSNIGADWYRYYITDTISDSSGKTIELSFSPRSPESFGFIGRMRIANRDSIFYVKSVEMRVPRIVNLNYVDNVYIRQEYMLDSLGKRHKTFDEMSLELQLIEGTQSFYASRLVANDSFSYDRHEGFGGYYDRVGMDFMVDEASCRPESFWNEMRLIPLSEAESKMGNLLSRLRKLPWFYWTEKALVILVQGYVETGKKSAILLGPVNTLISHNPTEGVRLRVGGITTANLSRHWFGSGYVAYGFHDHKWKYNAEAEYSFIEKKEHAREFPVNSLRLTHKYDVDMLGQHYLFTNPDNIFLSLKRGDAGLATYRRLSQLEYKLELNNNFSIAAGLRHEVQEATPVVPFITYEGRYIPHYTQTAFYVQLRYAPGEKFIQEKTTRIPVNLDAPVFMLTHEYGPKKFLGADFTLCRTEISAMKRFWFSAFGYADIILKGGKIWSQVQYPALMWQNANMSYTIQPESYSLMNPMEFATDYYGSLDLTYWINGAILNRIPLVKKLKLREVFLFKMLMGGLTKKNNPDLNDNLFRFPTVASITPLGKTPYMEIGCGLDNILSILRIDYVWRLTYLDVPSANRHGLRISLHFSF